MLTRRDMILRSSAAAVVVLDAARAAAAPMPVQAASPEPRPFTLPPLPYPADALEPYIDAHTMTIHHDRHHAAYVTNLNAAVAGRQEFAARTLGDLLANLDALPEDLRTAVRNQGGGHLNHTLFWTSLKKGGGVPPSGELGRAIEASFGTFTRLQDALIASALGVFGSGWTWLSVDRQGMLIVEPTFNQDNPISRGHRPLLGIDVWEHAYYLKYQNRRRDYLDAIFKVIDWDAVQTRWRAA